jgi:diacylglycerol kinase family enzyme
VYSYIYDEFLQDRRYERELALVETRLTDLGITGKIIRLALFRDAVQVMRSEVKAGCTTLVAVGNDETLYRAIEAVGDTKTVVAFIPIGGTTPMADLLGVPVGAAACDVLSARLVAEIDLGEVNGRRFLHAATLDGDGITAMCEESYTVTPLRKCKIEIRNLAEPDDAGAVDPTDGKLTLVMRLPRFSVFKKKEDIGIIPVRKVRFFARNGAKMNVDGEEIEAQEFDVRAIPGRLRLVTGKARKFST